MKAPFVPILVEDGATDETLVLMLIDVQETVRRQIAASEAMDEKAAAVLRFNGVYLGLALTMTSFALDGRFPAWPSAWPWYVVGALAVVLVLASILMAIAAYTVTRYFIGLRAADVLLATQQVVDARFHRLAALDRYAVGVSRNERNLDQTARWLQRALWAMAPGIAGLAAAAAGLIIMGNTSGSA